MSHNPETVNRFPTFPIPDSHLRGAAVLACSLIDHEETVSECRKERESLQQAIRELWCVVHRLADLLTRQDTALQLAVAAKEHPVFKASEWFWQSEASDHAKMLTRRARYLRAAKVGLDDAYDLLKEFCESASLAIDEELLRDVLVAAYQEVA
jgi:hypothetical protein